MAGASDNPSRRDVLGAAVAIPAAGLGSFETGLRQAQPLLRMSGNSSEWDETLAAYRTAERAVEMAGRVCSAASRAEIGAAEDAFGDRLEELYGALRRLLAVPAPDVGAFCMKVELAFEHELATLSGTSDCIASMREDARRFASG